MVLLLKVHADVPIPAARTTILLAQADRGDGNLIVKLYSFLESITNEINLVVLPKAIGKIPLANGSKVPACPTFDNLNFFFILNHQ